VKATGPAWTEALAAALGASDVRGLRRLSGGASRETWAFEADGRPLILQRARPGGVTSAALTTEVELLRAARSAGVPVPDVALSGGEVDGDDNGNTYGDAGCLGRSWMVLERIDGETIPRRILRDAEYESARRVLTAQCGRALAAVHSIDCERVPGLDPADQFERFRELLDAMDEPHPAFELGFRWLERNRPPHRADTVVHGDFRNGNLVVGPDGLRAVLDWELAHLGDPLEDLGWLCVRAWRFGAAPRVGGFGAVDELVAAYESAPGSPGTVDRDALGWWEAMGTLKWGVMCMLQAATHLSGTVRSVELAAIGRRVCEVEHDLLLLLP
jgi:aminoglycoside phosphotransferase (APT) family kinase protein